MARLGSSNAFEMPSCTDNVPFYERLPMVRDFTLPIGVRLLAMVSLAGCTREAMMDFLETK